MGRLPRAVPVRAAHRPRRLRRPGRRDDRARSSSRTPPTIRARGSARWWSTPVARARPARRTPSRPPTCSAPRSTTTSTSWGSTRAAPVSPPRSTACRTRRWTEFLAADPVPDDAEETDDVVDGLADFWAGCVANTRGGAGRHRRPRHHDRGRARHGRAAVSARRGQARLLRRVVRHQARRDLRRPVPRQGRPARPRRGRRRLARLGDAEPRPGRRLRACAHGVRRRLRRRGRLLPRRLDRGGPGDDHGPPRRHRRRTPARPRTAAS